MDFFSSIWNFFQALWDFLVNMVSSIITALFVVQDSMQLPALLPGIVPGIIGSCVAAVSAVAIIKLIIGWGNS